MNKFLWKNAQLVNGRTVNILTDGELISDISEHPHKADIEINLNEKIVVPGMIDPHVHVRDMELSHKETWTSASRAAAAGGITTIFDMPNTVPPTIDIPGLELKRKFAAKSLVNYGIHFGATPDNFLEIKAAPNIGGIKLFLARSSSAFPIPNEDETRKVFEVGAELNKPVIVHSECQDCIDNLEKIYEPVIHNHNKIRDPKCAVESTKMILKLTEEVGNTLYIAHVSTREELDMVRRAKDKGVKIFIEATPHHLLLDESILKVAGNYGKVNPPIRSHDDRLALWDAIFDGTVDTIGTDHAPHMKSEKDWPYSQAPSGFPGLETVVPLVFSTINKGRITLEKLVQLTSTNTAEIFRIKNRGLLEKGMYADFSVLSLESDNTIEADKFHSAAKYSPFNNMDVNVKVLKTVVNGREVYSNELFTENKGNEVDYY